MRGSATWTAKILRANDTACNDASGPPSSGAKADWEDCVKGIRPQAATILKSARTWFDYDRVAGGGSVCSEPRCPRCWNRGHLSLVNSQTLCSRIKHGISPKASSGKGFLEEGDIKSATKDGPTPRAWAVGDGSGENVEIFCNPEARKRNLAGDGEVTLGKILSFFSVRGNRRAGNVGGGPLMEYVLVYEYVTCGTGRSKKEEAATSTRRIGHKEG